MRLIDADEFMNMMYHEAFETDSELQKWDSGCWIRYKMLENVIEKAPTIEERKTGRWIVETDCEGKTRTIVCPFCGWEHGKYKWTNDNFCGGCGAKMEGAEGG